MVYWLSAVEMTAVASSDSFYLFFDDCRYFIPFQFSFFLLLGVAALKSKVRRICAAFLLILGILSLNSILFREPWGRVAKYKGYSYSQLGGVRGHIWPQFYPAFEDYLESLSRYREPDRFYVLWNSLYGLQFEKDLRNPEKIKHLKEHFEEKYWPAFAENLGYAIGVQSNIAFRTSDPVLETLPPKYRGFFYMGFVSSTIFNNLENVSNYLQWAAPLSGEERKWFYFMMGEFCPFNLGVEGRDLVLKRVHQESPQEVSAFFRGVGVRCMLNWMVDGFEFSQAMKNLEVKVPEEYEKDFYWGVGWGVRQESAEDRQRGLDWLKELPPEHYPSAWEGFKNCEETYQIPNA